MRPTCKVLSIVALGGVAIAVPVFAQPPPDYPPPCDSSKVSNADTDRAHTVFLSGKQFLEESNYDKAISYFKDAYSIDCSRHAMLPIIATAFERKGDKGEAVRALEEYVRRAPNAADHEVIERRIKNLKDQLARDQPTSTASAPVPSASSSAAPPQPSASVSAEPTASASSAAPPAPAAPPSGAGGAGALPWVIVGVGGAATLAGIVLFAAGSGDISSALKDCPNRACMTQAAVDRGNNGRGLENLGGVLIGGGLAVAAAGVVWHFLEKPAESASSAPAAGPRLTPVVARGYAGIELGSRF
jgi:tetratricopeptide (TPR) repeat protein